MWEPQSKFKSKEQERNFIPNKEVAIKIAEAVWLLIYGLSILKKKPFKAVLRIEGDVRIITGSLPKGSLGRVPSAEIQKSDEKD